MIDNETKQNGGESAVSSGPAADQAPGAAAGVEASPLTPEAEIARLGEENAKLRDQALRALAEAENTRRRAQREREDTAKFAVSDLARELLTVADNLRRAIEAVPADLRRDSSAVGTLVDGVAAIERQLLSAFDKHGIMRIDPMEQKFDPNFHQAMFEVPDNSHAPGTVVQVIQPGYVIHGRLLRPALVGVAKAEPMARVDTVA